MFGIIAMLVTFNINIIALYIICITMLNVTCLAVIHWPSPVNRNVTIYFVQSSWFYFTFCKVAVYFLKIFNHTKFQSPVLNETSVSHLIFHVSVVILPTALAWGVKEMARFILWRIVVLVN